MARGDVSYGLLHGYFVKEVEGRGFYEVHAFMKEERCLSVPQSSDLSSMVAMLRKTKSPFRIVLDNFSGVARDTVEIRLEKNVMDAIKDRRKEILFLAEGGDIVKNDVSYDNDKTCFFDTSGKLLAVYEGNRWKFINSSVPQRNSNEEIDLSARVRGYKVLTYDWNRHAGEILSGP